MSYKTVNFLGFKCMVVKQNYQSNNKIALELIDIKNSEPVLTATVNIEGVNLKEDEVLIKNYSENFGIRGVLMDNKIISKPLEFNINGLDVTKHKLLNI